MSVGIKVRDKESIDRALRRFKRVVNRARTLRTFRENMAFTKPSETKRLERYGILNAKELGGGGFRRWAASDPWMLWHAFALAAWCEATLGDGPDALRELLPRG